MTNVSSKEAAVLTYLAKHPELEPDTKEHLLSSLGSPAREIAERIIALTTKQDEPVVQQKRASPQQKRGSRSKKELATA